MEPPCVGGGSRWPRGVSGSPPHAAAREPTVAARNTTRTTTRSSRVERLTAHEHLRFFAQLKGRKYERAVREADELLAIFHLSHRRDHLGA